MPSNLRIVHVRDFLSFHPEGTLDFAKVKEDLHEAVLVPGAFGDYDLLVDVRGAEAHLSVTDLWEIAEELAAIVHAHTSKRFTAKIAILCPVEHFDHAEFFELCARNRGLNVRASTSFEDLFEWLSESSTPRRAESS
jgi:hypothetical protein